MNQNEWAYYAEEVQKAAAKAEASGREAFFRTLIEETEKIVPPLAERLRQEGVDYPTENENRAVARTVLWAAWTSWLWAAKSERHQQGGVADHDAQRIRPVFDRLLDEARRAGASIGAGGRTPNEFLR